jgi:hypothetical protein
MIAFFSEDIPNPVIRLLFVLLGGIFISIVQVNYDRLRERVKNLEEKIKGGADNAE